MNTTPTPTPPSTLPPTMRVAVELGYVHNRPDCMRVLEATSGAAFRDAQVTRFVAVPGRKHAHEVTEGSRALPGLATALNAPAPAALAGPALFAASGYASDIDHPDGPEIPNGFDPKGRE